MRHYEVVFLVHPDQSDQVLSMIERYRKMIGDGKGVIHRLENWGRRQLAYSIDKVHKAHYVLMNIECDDAILNELMHSFRFSDAVLRHFILRRDEAITQSSPLSKEYEKRSDVAVSKIKTPVKEFVQKVEVDTSKKTEEKTESKIEEKRSEGDQL